jgi:hypothetical protein
MGEYTFAQDSDAPSSIQEYAAKIFSRDNETQFIQTALFDQNGIQHYLPMERFLTMA